jgi:hypothetical protein
MKVRGEFSGADCADPFHQPRAAVISVDIDHVVYALKIGCDCGKLKVDEVHMIGKDHVGCLESLHIDLFDLVFLADEHDLGEKPDQPRQIDRLANGVLCGLVTSFVFIIYVNIHGMPMPFPWIFPSIILNILSCFLRKSNSEKKKHQTGSKIVE